jgi:hypothetical protein
MAQRIGGGAADLIVLYGISSEKLPPRWSKQERGPSRAMHVCVWPPAVIENAICRPIQSAFVQNGRDEKEAERSILLRDIHNRINHTSQPHTARAAY